MKIPSSEWPILVVSKEFGAESSDVDNCFQRRREVIGGNPVDTLAISGINIDAPLRLMVVDILKRRGYIKAKFENRRRGKNV